MTRKKLTKNQIQKRNKLGKKLEKHPEIEEPYGLATYMVKKGVKLHRKKK